MSLKQHFRPMHVYVLLALCVPWGSASSTASAGLIRHDRDLQQYREMGKEPQFACVGSVFLPKIKGYATGVLIAPKWVLTCEHVVRRDSMENQIWQFGKQQFRAVRVIRFPGSNTVERIARMLKGIDMALVELDRPVDGIAPAVRYEKQDEVGRLASLVGYGRRGNGKSGVESPYVYERLAGQNIIDRVGGKLGKLTVSQNILLFDFDSPEAKTVNHFGGSKPTELEIGVSDGSSGGALFIERNGNWYLAGLLGLTLPQSGDFYKRKTERYGQINGAIRLSSRNKWIDEVLADPVAYEKKATKEAGVEFKVVGPSGKPLSGYSVIGATQDSTKKVQHETSTLIIPALDPRKRRTFVVIHEKLGLGKVVRLTTDEVASMKGVVKLLPLATVTAQLIDEFGKPVRNTLITPIVMPRQQVNRRMPASKTDNDGRLKFKVPCWSKYRLLYDPTGSAFVDTPSVRPGLNYDLGKVQLLTARPTDARQSESTIKRLIRDITADAMHDDRKFILPTHKELERLRHEGEPYIWKIDRTLLLRRYRLEKETEEGSGRTDQTDRTTTSDGQLVESLRDRLVSQDDQIQTLKTQLDR